MKELEGIKSSATNREIKSAYFAKSKLYHPDVTKDDKASKIFQKISKAYEILGSPQLRKNYDKSIYKPNVMREPAFADLQGDYSNPGDILDKQAYTDKTHDYWMHHQNMRGFADLYRLQASRMVLRDVVILCVFMCIGGLIVWDKVVHRSILPDKCVKRKKPQD